VNSSVNNFQLPSSSYNHQHSINRLFSLSLSLSFWIEKNCGESSKENVLSPFYNVNKYKYTTSHESLIMVCLIPTISSLSSTQLLFPLGSNDNRKRVGKVIPGSYRSWKLGRYYCLALFVITSLILIDEANGSHIMTSESKEAEFEMIHTNNGDDSEERLKKKKTLVSEDDEMTKSDGSKVPKGHKRNGGTPPGPQPIGVPDVVITNKGSGGGINEEEGQVDSSNEGRDARNSIGTPLNEVRGDSYIKEYI